MQKFLAILGGLALMVVQAGCGSDGPSCGAGTTEVNGECVPSGGGVTCATGTVLSGNECVPDGTVICETGTTFDETSGSCVPDITGCAAGTVLVSGECVPYDDTLTGDVEELAEPNGFEAAATTALVPLPAVGDDVVIHGCFEPRPDYDLNDSPDGDLDVYAFQVTTPTLLDVTVDGVNGAAGAFQIIGFDAAGQLNADGWARIGLNLVGDTSQRQVYLPKAGVYLMILADSRTLAFGEGVGDGSTTCYFATVANTAIPTPTAISGTTQTGTLSGDAQFFSYDPGEGDVIRSTLSKVGVAEAVDGGLVTFLDDAYIGAVETSGASVEDVVNGTTDSSSVVFVVEESFNLGLTPVDFVLDLEVVTATAMPADGTITIAPQTGDNYFYFDVAAAGDFVDFSFDDEGNGGGATYYVDIIGQRDSYFGSTVLDYSAEQEYVYFANPGRYYIQVWNNDDVATADVDATVTRATMTIPTVTQGTGATGVGMADWTLQPFDAPASAGFAKMDVTDARWLVYSLTPTDFGDTPLTIVVPRRTGTMGDLVLDWYFGSPGSDTLAEDDERIFNAAGDASALVIVIDQDPGAQGSNPAFDLSVDDQLITGSGTVDEANPVAMTGVTLAADETKYFLFDLDNDTEFDISADPDSTTDVSLDLYTATGLDTIIDDNGDDGAETFSENIGEGSYLAFAVSELNGATGTFDLSVTLADPPYAREDVDMDLTSACLNGTRMDLETFTDGVSAAQTIGFDFDFFGATNTELYITDRGWLAFTAPTDSTAASIDDAIVPMATDDVVIQDICVDATATSYTVQWRGQFNGADGRFQAILHDDGVIEFGYTDGNDAATSDVGLYGIETLLWRGSIGSQQVIRFTPQ